MTPEQKEAFRSRIAQATSSTETLRLLHELHSAQTDDFNEEEVIGYTLDALNNLRRQSRVEGVWPRTALIAYALPLGLKVSDNEETRFELYSLRQLLGEWINELPTPWAVSLLEECISLLLPKLETATGEDLRVTCWLLGDLGFRTPELVEALETVVRRNPDYSGDVALGTLVGLGNVGANRDKYLSIARERAVNRYNNSLDFVLSLLPDESTIDFVVSTWIAPERDDSPNMEKIGGAITILGRIAKSIDNDRLHDRIVEILQDVQMRFARHLGFTMVVRGDILTKCNSENVVRFIYDLTTMDVPIDGKGEGEGALRLATLRLLDAVLPRQLNGCSSTPPDLMLSKFKGLLLQSEDYVGRSMTQLNHLKEHALDVLLKLGRPELISWFDDVSEVQKNPYSKNELFRSLAAFSLPRIPERIAGLITESIELKSGPGDPELLVRLAASRLVRSAGTWEAFTLLLRPGLTYNGAVMLDTVEALADVSVHLCRQGERKAEVISALIGQLESSSDPVVSSTCRALNALALSHQLSSQSIAPIARYIEQPSPENRAFVKGLMIQALGAFREAELPQGVVRLLEEWAMHHDGWLGWRSIETLVRLRDTFPAEFYAKLGLVRIENKWAWDESKSTSIWSATFVVLLSEKRPEEFAEAVADAVLAQNWEVSDRTVMGLVALQQRTNGHVQKSVGEALLEKARRRNRPNSADTAVISYLPQLCPTEFSAETWTFIWSHWTDDSRAELAKSFGKLQPEYVTEKIINALALLMNDAHFGVRRSAVRSMSKLHPSHLSGLVQRAAASEYVEDRKRACEFLEWLTDADLAQSLANRLMDDTFGSIRELAEKSFDERKRHQFTARYFSIIADQREWDNESILALSRYAQALAQLGDDETLEMIESFLEQTDLPSHVRYWAIRISKELENNWKGRVQKWPEPLNDTKGTIQTGSGRIKMNDLEVPVDFKIWSEVSSNLGGQFKWGGTALVRNASLPDNFLGSDRILVLGDNREFRVGVFGILNVQDRVHVDFQGIDDYPGNMTSP